MLIMSTVADWDKNADGTIKLNPLVGFEAAPMRNGMAGFVRIVYLTGGPNKETGALQLGIAYPEVKRIIAELEILDRQLAENLAADVPAGKPS
jgi:hypothetical protein